jgi:cysteine desulfurase/selenocysteine lyase
LRKDFPILGRTVNGRPLVYLDNAASAQKPRAVISAMSRAMEESYANVHRGLHTLSNEATDAFEKARRTVADFISADPTEIVFTKGATEAINLVASGLGLEIEAGDEILLTQMEHHANIVPWHFVRERRGAVLKFAPVFDDGTLDLDALRAAVTPRTKVVALTHMSNVTGVRVDVAAAAAAARSVGAKVLVDGSQAIVHEPIDVKALGCDFYVFSGHKLYGPTGIGVLWGRPEALQALPPYQGGGEMIASVSFETVVYAEPPHRFEAGTPAILEAVGLGAAIDWLSRVDRRAAAQHERALHDRARDRLRQENWIRILGDVEDKGAILSFTVDGVHAHDIAQVLDRYGVAVRAGTHCAEPLMRRFGVSSSVRASFALYNTLEECDAFVDALIKAHRFFD